MKPQFFQFTAGEMFRSAFVGPGNILGKLPEKERLCVHLLQREISTLSARYFVMSAVHTEEDIDKTVNALEASLDAMREEGTL